MPKGKQGFQKGHAKFNNAGFKKGHIPWHKGKRMFQTSGNKHWNWKGRKKHSSGYILILKPNHPFCDKRGYVRRSHLVMEKMIGRFLKPKEEVHHINGIRNDDRPENLKLFPNKEAHTHFHNNMRKLEKNIKGVTGNG